MKKTAFVLGMLFTTLSFAQSLTPYLAKLKEPAPLNKTSDFLTPEILPCQPLAKTTVKVIAQASMSDIPHFLSRVEIQDGQCKGSIGWVTTSRLISGV